MRKHVGQPLRSDADAREQSRSGWRRERGLPRAPAFPPPADPHVVSAGPLELPTPPIPPLQPLVEPRLMLRNLVYYVASWPTFATSAMCLASSNSGLLGRMEGCRIRAVAESTSVCDFSRSQGTVSAFPQVGLKPRRRVRARAKAAGGRRRRWRSPGARPFRCSGAPTASSRAKIEGPTVEESGVSA
jgi:hypothetical protein